MTQKEDKDKDTGAMAGIVIGLAVVGCSTVLGFLVAWMFIEAFLR